MFLITTEHCQNCKMVKDFIDRNGLVVEIKMAQDCMDFCREHNIRSVPALVCDNGEVLFSVADIIDCLTAECANA